MSIETKSAPTKAQMQAAIAQTLALSFAYNAPVDVLDFKVDDTGKISGRFKDSARPRVFDFELDGNTVNFKPYAPGRMDSGDVVEQWEEFSSGYSYRFDTKAKTKAKGKAGDTKKPQCVKPTAYNCGKACINIKNNCKSNPDDAKSKDRLEKLKAAGIDYAKEVKKSTAKTKKKAEKPPEIDKTPEMIEEIPPSEKGKESSIEEGKKATEIAVESKDQTETPKQPEGKPKNLNLVGDGTHEGVPNNAKEYQEAIAKAGGEITLEEAQRVVKSVSDWTYTSYPIKKAQKEGKFNQQAEDIASFVKNSTPYKGEIFRGIDFPGREAALEWLRGDENGVLGNQSAHASWTSKKEVARKFSQYQWHGNGSQAVVVEVVNKSGASIGNLANPQYKDQGEVVVLKDTRHKVKSFVEKEDGIIYAQVEEVESSEDTEQKETTKTPEKKPKNLNLVGNGDHESMPSTAEEYRKALKKSGVNISEKEAADTTTAIYKWTRSSTDIRVDQKAGEENEDANRISNYVRNSTPYKGEVYRGINFASKEEALNWTKGDKDGILDNQGTHASWSSSLKTAEEFSDTDYTSFGKNEIFPVIVKTINKSGASIRNLSNIAEEDEVIILKDTRHRVKGVKEENGRIIVEAEEI